LSSTPPESLGRLCSQLHNRGQRSFRRWELRPQGCRESCAGCAQIRREKLILDWHSGPQSAEDRRELTALIALKQPERGRRVAAAWLQRYLDEMPQATIDHVLLLAPLLSASGGQRHDQALRALPDLLG
jgi:hypothetical protein